MKPSPAKLPLTLSVALLLAASCNQQERATGAELEQIERALSRLEQAGPEDRAVVLDDLAQMPIETPSLVAMRNSCVAAYQAFFEAKREMSRAKQMTASLEADVGAPTLAADNGDRLLARAAAATEALDASDKALARADAQLASCTTQRQEAGRQ